MKSYKILSPVILREGVVRLTEEQARGREQILESVKDKNDHYRITGPNQFKAGQEIGYDGEIPKAFAGEIEEMKKGEPAQPAPASPPAQPQAKPADDKEKSGGMLGNLFKGGK